MGSWIFKFFFSSYIYNIIINNLYLTISIKITDAIELSAVYTATYLYP